ncbi:MAG: hypothetical protein AB9856_05305 [Cellulosilyticaceae bacterium]
MDKIIEFTSPTLWEWAIQIINIVLWLFLLGAIFYGIFLGIKVLKKTNVALAIWLKERKSKL